MCGLVCGQLYRWCTNPSCCKHYASNSDRRCNHCDRYRNDHGILHGISCGAFVWEVRLGSCKWFCKAFNSIIPKYGIQVAIIFVLYLGQITRFTESDFGGSGTVEAGDIISFGATVGAYLCGLSDFQLPNRCTLSRICAWLDKVIIALLPLSGKISWVCVQLGGRLHCSHAWRHVLRQDFLLDIPRS